MPQNESERITRRSFMQAGVASGLLLHGRSAWTQASEARPAILFSDDVIEALRRRTQNDSEARDRFDRIRKRVDAGLDVEFTPPPMESPERRTVEIRNFEEHRALTISGQELISQLYSSLHAAMMRSVCYAVTGEIQYRDRAADVVLAYARSPGLFLNARTSETALGNSRFVMTYLMSVDLLRGCFSSEEQSEIDAYLARVAQAIIDDSVMFLPSFERTNVYSNHMAFHHGTVGVVGVYLDNQQFIDWALHAKAGFFDLVDEGILDRGLWQEGTTSYHFATLTALAQLAIAFRNRNLQPDLFTAKSPRCNTLEMLYEGPVRLAFPDMTLPCIGDTYGHINSLKGHWAYVPAWHFLKKPLYGWLLSESKSDKSRRRDAMLPLSFFLSSEGASGEPVPVESELFKEHGYAVLKHIESVRYWGSDSLVAVMTFDRTRQHSHADKLGIILFGQGKLLAPDIGARSTERGLNFFSLIRKNWSIRTAAHNTVVVDEKDQRSIKKQLDLVLYEKNKQFGIVSAADFGTLYSGINQRRTLLMTDDYFLDVFSVTSNEEHTYDWVLRAFDDEGRTRTADSGRPFEFGAEEGPYSIMRNVEARQTDEAWDCHWRQDDVRFRLSMLGEPGTQVIFAEGPRDDQYTPPNIPMVLARRATKATNFVSLLVPTRDEASGHTLERLDSDGDLLRFRIAGLGYEDFLVLNTAFEPRPEHLTIVCRNETHIGDSIYLYHRFPL